MRKEDSMLNLVDKIKIIKKNKMSNLKTYQSQFGIFLVEFGMYLKI